MSGAAGAGNRALMVLFVMMLLIPGSFYLGETRLTTYRVFLLVAMIPVGIRWISGQAGGVTRVDLLVLFHALWIILALLSVHGMSRFAFGAATAIELFCGYLLGRILIRSAEDYRTLFKVYFGALLFLLPFALVETFTERRLISDAVAPFLEIYNRPGSSDPRWGLERVMGPFEHAILFGLFATIGIANLFYIHAARPVLGLLKTGFCGFFVFLSLSSGPLLAALLQIGLMVWNRVTRGAWLTLAVLTAIAYVTVDMLSNRTPITILIETMTFNPLTGWTRINTWNYGSEVALANPIFGIGLNDWPRPGWLTSSVDNYWLLNAMRYGIVGWALIFAAAMYNLYRVGRARITDPRVRALRVGYMIAAVAIYLTLCTVHMWGAVSVFMMFYIGAGAWFYTGTHDTPDEAEPVAAPDGAHRTAPPLSRGAPAGAATRTGSGAPAPRADGPGPAAPARRGPAPRRTGSSPYTRF